MELMVPFMRMSPPSTFITITFVADRTTVYLDGDLLYIMFSS